MFMGGRSSYQIKLCYRWFEKILLNLKMIFSQNVMQKTPVFFLEKEVEIVIIEKFTLEEMLL